MAPAASDAGPPAHGAPAERRVDARAAARATVFALVATGLEKGGAMLVLLAVARLLGPQDFGRYAALMALLALCQVAGELGQEPVLVRMFAQQQGRATPALVGGALAMRLAGAALAGIALVVIGATFLDFPAATLALAALGLLAGAGMSLRALFRSVHRLEWLCVTALANVGGFALALAASASAAAGLSGVVAAWSVGQGSASLAAVGLARGITKPWPRWRPDVTRRLAASGWPLALNAFLLTVTLRAGQLIVLRLDGATAVAHLAAGSRLAEAFALLPESVMLVLLPVLSAAATDGAAPQRDISARAVRYLGILALALIVVVSITAPDLLRVLFGPAYVTGAPALRVLVWLALLAASGTVFTNLLIARGRERLLLVLSAFGSVLTIGLSLLLVPRYGFVGAAAATLVASVAAQALLVVLPPLRDDVLACLRPLAVPITAGAVLAIVGSVVPGPRVVIAAAALAAFAVAVLASGALDGHDWRLLKRVVGTVPSTAGLH